MASIATSHGLSTISAVIVASTPRAGMIVRPENAANAARTSRMSAFSQAIVMRGCCCCGPCITRPTPPGPTPPVAGADAGADPGPGTAGVSDAFGGSVVVEDVIGIVAGGGVSTLTRALTSESGGVLDQFVVFF